MKRNNFSRRTMGLTVLVLIACLCLSVGVAWGRYRSQEIENVGFMAQPQKKLYIWVGAEQMEQPEEGTPEDGAAEDGTAEDDPAAEDSATAEDDTAAEDGAAAEDGTTGEDGAATDETVGTDNVYAPMPDTWPQSSGDPSLVFHVTNGETEEDACPEDVTFRVRLFATLGIRYVDNLTIYLTTSDMAGAMVSATAVRVEKGTDESTSPLYDSMGEGWLYRFFDEDGNELTWTLAGGQLSSQTIIILGERSGVAFDPTALQLMVIEADV